MKRLFLAGLLLFAGRLGAAETFRLVANASVPVTTLSKGAAAAIFLKKMPKWTDGTAVVPVDQSESSVVRAAFTTAVHGKAVNAIKSYWQQQIFSGREVPPVEKPTDAEVLSYVRSTPGAIGYVTSGAAAPGVKFVEIQ